MNNKYVILMIIILIYLVIAIWIVLKIEQREKKKSIFSFRKRQMQNNFLFSIYYFLLRFPMTREYVQKVQRRFEVYSPRNQFENVKRTMKLVSFICAICLLEFGLVYGFNQSISSAVVALIVIVVLNNEIINLVVRNTDIKLLMQMEQFFSDVKHYYYETRLVDLAILDGMKTTGKEMKAHALLLYDTITSDYRENAIKKYNEIVKITHLKLFLSSCIQVMEFGDKEVNGQQIFQSNLHYLRLDVEIEKLKQEKIIFLFSGKIFVTVTPILFLQICKNYGISILPELKTFYTGYSGLIIMILSIFLVILCYILIVIARDNNKADPYPNTVLNKLCDIRLIHSILDNYTERYYSRILKLKQRLKEAGDNNSYRHFLLNQFLFFFFALFLSLSLSAYIHITYNNYLCYDVSSVGTTNSNLNSSEIIQIHDAILQYVEEYKRQGFSSVDYIEHIVLEEFSGKKSTMKEIVVSEVFFRVNSYQNNYYKWYELIFSLLAAFLGYHIPSWLLIYRKKMARQQMDQEVTQFHSIILMLMHMDHMSILIILETMETFATFFKLSIQECIRDFGAGSEEALRALKEKENYETFRRLIDNLMISDKIGIVKAFDEIASDRVSFQERKKQDNDIMMKKNSDNANFIQFFPFSFIVGAYLIIPIILECVRVYKQFAVDVL